MQLSLSSGYVTVQDNDINRKGLKPRGRREGSFLLSLLLLTQSTYLLPSSQPTALPSSIRDSSSGNRIGKQTDRPDRLMRLPSSRKKARQQDKKRLRTTGAS
ncbi:hypothetical protein SDJN03_18650, partial [Cucurbita argyrosperma subsp. sororia]